MTKVQLVMRGLRFHWRTHLGVVLGAAVATSVLVGALVVGDSVRGSLQRLALVRLGEAHFAMAVGDRMFREQLAGDIADAVGAPVAAALTLDGLAAGGPNNTRLGGVAVNGVDDSFWAMGGASAPFDAGQANHVALNKRLADALGVGRGDSVLLRIAKPSALPRDVGLGSDSDESVALRLTVRAVVGDEQFGRFSLRANQTPPLNAFVPLKLLQEKAEVAGRANLLLVGSPGGDAPAPTLEQLTDALKRRWTLDDAQLVLRTIAEQGVVELSSDRVFIDEVVADAAMRAAPDPQPILTYFVNELRRGERMTPYSMVAALPPVSQGPIPDDLRDDEVVINEWLAEDLMLAKGDRLDMKFFVIGSQAGLTETTVTLTVRDIVPIQGACGDPTLMPDFPGLAEAESARNWEPGIPIDLARIRDKDEQYWKDHRGTPKAFVTLATGRKLWGNRFGDLTAIRYRDDGSIEQKVRGAILSGVDPARLNLSFLPVREQALRASREGYDFSGLFIGFSFFLIVAAGLLTGLLFVFGVEQRTSEAGVLLAMGYRPRQVRRLAMMEGAVLAVLGAAIGLPLGIVYTKAMLAGLTTIWRDAVGMTSLHYAARPASLVIGFACGIVVALAAMAWGLQRHARRPVRALIATGPSAESDATEQSLATRATAAKWVAVVSLVIAAGLAPVGLIAEGSAAAGAFFGSGFALLTGLVAAGRWLIARLGAGHAAAHLTLAALGRRNNARRAGRSLATIALLACGTFLVVAVGVFRLDAGDAAHRRDSGTGGFAFIAESALPLLHDPTTDTGREALNLSARELPDVSFVPLRVRDGDDASCLNLNRAQQPRLLGVDGKPLAERDAFTFVYTIDNFSTIPWASLLEDDNPADDIVPGFVDHATLIWALGRKPGDTLDYVDERGRPFKVRVVGTLANSILQGSVIIDNDAFVARYPSAGGYRLLLIDAPADRTDEVAATISRALADHGIQLTRAVERLAQFNEVQNTYLSIFQLLGGLGLLLGCAGLGMVVLRNVLERRAELALLRSVGFTPAALHRLLLSEHWLLLALGLVSGIVAALVAVAPTLAKPDMRLPLAQVSATLLLVVVSGMVWTWIATRAALRGRLLGALRNE